MESVFKYNDKASAPINSGTRQGIYYSWRIILKWIFKKWGGDAWTG